jgi:hypothetical protein
VNSIKVSIDYIKSLNYFKGSNITDDIKIFDDVKHIVASSWLMDRTSKATTPFRSSLLCEYKINSESFSIKNNLTLDEICYNAACLFKDTPSKLYILWSGGLDSTLLIISMLKANVDKEKIVVACNPDGLKENYNFYRKFILPNFRVIASEKLMQQARMSGSIDGIIINGDPADALYGIDLSLSLVEKYGINFLKNPCSRDIVTNYFVSQGMELRSANCWYDFFMASSVCSPKKIQTISDLSWWMTFNHRWQSANEKLKLRLSNDLNHKTFFGTEEFQNWACYRDNNLVNTVKEFKLEFKKLIFDYTGDLEYFTNKIKLHSNSYAYGSNSYSAVLNNNQKLLSTEFNIYDFYNKDNFMTDWLSIN